MHKQFMKLIVGGTLAVVVTLIVVGTASARVYTASETSAYLLGYPKGVVGAPGLDSSNSAPATRHEPLSVTLAGYPRGVIGAPGLDTAKSTPTSQHVQKSQVAAGYSAFPEVVRTMNLGNTTSATSNGFDWNDAGIGVGVAAGVLSIIALLGIGIRRSKSTPATA